MSSKTDKEFEDEDEEQEDEVKQLTAGNKPLATHSEEGAAILRSRSEYNETVQLRLTNLIFDPLSTMLFEEAGIHPDEAHLLGLTRINSSLEAVSWANQILRDAIYNQNVKGHTCNWSPSQIWRVAFLLCRRSIPGECGPGFTLGIGLAQEQNIAKAEEEGDPGDW